MMSSPEHSTGKSDNTACCTLVQQAEIIKKGVWGRRVAADIRCLRPVDERQ